MARNTRFAVVLLMLALAMLACNLTGDGGGQQDETVPTLDAPTVEIRVPTNGTSFAEGTNVIVQVVGMDSGAGVSRLDLEVDDQPAGSMAAPNAAGQTAFIANFEWQAVGQGLHSITARAARQNGTTSTPVSINVNVIAAPPTQAVQPTAQPTSPPAEVQPTVQAQPTNTPPEPTNPPPTATPSGPRGTITAGVNVRRGPSTQYETIGSMLAGTEVDLIGRNRDSTWFLVPYALSQGWVFGQFINATGDINSLPVITPPPLPPTATPIPPTPIPATPVPAGPSIFWRTTVDENATYAPGTCFRFWWQVSNVAAVYFQGQGVSGDNNTDGREICINTTTTFTLRVTLNDGTEETRQTTAKIQ